VSKFSFFASAILVAVFIPASLPAQEPVRLKPSVRGVLGAKVETITPKLWQDRKLPSPFGVVVTEVAAQGPATIADLRVDDVIVAVNGQPVASREAFRGNDLVLAWLISF
jgi:S1-C subfamily serine protease